MGGSGSFGGFGQQAQASPGETNLNVGRPGGNMAAYVPQSQGGTGPEQGQISYGEGNQQQPMAFFGGGQGQPSYYGGGGNQGYYGGWGQFANMFNPYSYGMPQAYTQPAYSPNNFMLPMFYGSQNLMQQFANNPTQSMAAYSPAAFRQMASFFPQGMANGMFNQNLPTAPAQGQPPGAPPAGAPGQENPWNPVVPSYNQPAAEPQPQAPAPQQGAPNQEDPSAHGLWVPEYNMYVQPYEIDQQINSGRLAPEIFGAMQNILTNDPDRVNNPWMHYYYNWTSRG